MLVHDLANELLDAWAAGDREQYRAIRDRQHQQYPPPEIEGEGPAPASEAEKAEQLARWQIQVYEQNRRIFGWRYQGRSST